MNTSLIHPRLRSIENSFSIVILSAMCLIPLMEIAGLRLLGRGIPGSIPLVQNLTLWIAFLGAALAARSKSLLALSTNDFLPDAWSKPARIFTAMIAAGVAASLFVGSVVLVRGNAGYPDEVALGIPLWIAQSIMPIGFALVTGRLIWNASNEWIWRLVAALGLLIPVILGLGFDTTLEGTGLVLPLSLVILAATALGMPIFAAIGGVAVLLWWNDGYSTSQVPGEAYRLATQAFLPAIPLFTLGGFILAAGGASQRLMRSFTALVGWMPGGLAIVTTLVLAFFTPLTGASGVTILSMGGLLLPVMTKSRYPEGTSVGLVTVSGSIGLLLPPSLPVILYAVYAGVGVLDLFTAALVPGILLILVVAGWGAARGWWAGAPATRFVGREAVSATWNAKWELLLPVIIVVAYFRGYATLVETAAFTVLYALVVECFIYKDLKLGRDFPRIAIECATLVGSFFIILCAALGFNSYLVNAQVPTLATEWIQTQITSPIVFLLALNVLLIIVGALMDIYSAIFIIAPLIAPIGLAYGIDPVHLGVIFLANMELGYLMPPMGENLFLSSMRFKLPLGRIYKYTLPYIVLITIVVLIITYVPALSLGLGKLLGN